MSDITNARTPPAALTGSMRDFRVPGGADLLDAPKAFSSGKICVVRMVSGHFPARPKMGLARFAGHRTIVATRCMASILRLKTT